jgi:hypothetical protein
MKNFGEASAAVPIGKTGCNYLMLESEELEFNAPGSARATKDSNRLKSVFASVE